MTTTAKIPPKVKLAKTTQEWEGLYDYVVLINGSKYVYLRKTLFGDWEAYKDGKRFGIRWKTRKSIVKWLTKKYSEDAEAATVTE